MKQKITLQRSCSAIKVPSGSFSILKVGQDFNLVHSNVNGFIIENMYREIFQIDLNDADALGCNIENSCHFPLSDLSALSIKDFILYKLKTCYDPEIAINVVDLGLIYELNIENFCLEIKMTLTSIGCGMGDSLKIDICSKLLEILDLQKIKIVFVFSPAWNLDMVSDTGKLELGMSKV